MRYHRFCAVAFSVVKLRTAGSDGSESTGLSAIVSIAVYDPVAVVSYKIRTGWKSSNVMTYGTVPPSPL
jgi:hypothetical protein